MISRLHYITQELSTHTHDEQAERACEGGADWVQLRIKNKSYNECLEIALKTEAVCRKYHAKLIVNDYVNIAKAIRADGIHLGKTDMSPREARALLGNKSAVYSFVFSVVFKTRRNTGSDSKTEFSQWRFVDRMILRRDKIHTAGRGVFRSPCVANGGHYLYC